MYESGYRRIGLAGAGCRQFFRIACQRERKALFVVRRGSDHGDCRRARVRGFGKNLLDEKVQASNRAFQIAVYLFAWKKIFFALRNLPMDRRRVARPPD